MSLCERCIVIGHVQGVFFRASTQQKARDLGLKGYAKNLPDGHVEVMICGNPEAVGHLKAWLWQGPAAAIVSQVKCELVENPEVPSGFETY
jgi:acylphosphatase